MLAPRRAGASGPGSSIFHLPSSISHSPFAIRRSRSSGGFTLVELLVVVTIIGLLVAILIPSLHGARVAAKVADTTATLRAIDGGLETFKADSTLGGTFPPSASDNADHFTIKSPLDDSDVLVAGAHLLVFALFGADLLGSPGFPDSGSDGWWNDMTNAAGGAYELDGNDNPVRPRFGPFCDDSMTAKIARVNELTARGIVAKHSLGGTADALPVLIDTWKRPILYYKARRAASRMMTGTATDATTPPGVYDFRDNQAFTGTPSDDGVLYTPKVHEINSTTYPPDNAPSGFSAYILDESVTVRPTPVNRESYLLISAGPDGIYGNRDDVTNWK